MVGLADLQATPTTGNDGYPQAKVATTRNELHAIERLRKACYGKHERPIDVSISSDDLHPSNVLLYVGDRSDPEGTIRVRFAGVEQAYGPLVDAHLGVCAFERLAIPPSREAMAVKWSLFKAAYLLAFARGVHSIVVTTVRPLDRGFKQFGFKEASRTRLPWYNGEQILLRMTVDIADLYRHHPVMYRHIVEPNENQAVHQALQF